MKKVYICPATGILILQPTTMMVGSFKKEGDYAKVDLADTPYSGSFNSRKQVNVWGDEEDEDY